MSERRFALRKAERMSDDDLHDQIARLEVDIDKLAESLERCRKAMLFSNVAIAAGVIWILAYLLGTIRFEPATMIGAIAAVIGGVVVFGSNWSTSKQTTAAIKATEMRRAELIDMTDPRSVGTNREWRLQRIDSKNSRRRPSNR
jgi:hypothetical protein